MRTLLWPGLFAGLGMTILVALGVWQLQRLVWKRDLIARIETGLNANPVTLGDVEAGIEYGYDVDWLRVRAKGHFRHDLERHLYMTRDGGVGWQVATPLETAEGLSIWVDRGFVADAVKDAARRPQGQVEGEVEVVGLIRVRDATPDLFTPDNERDRNIWYWWDLQAMTASASPPVAGAVMPVMLETSGEAPPGGWPQPWNRRSVTLPNNHLQYALTWFALALCLAGVTTVYSVGILRKPS